MFYRLEQLNNQRSLVVEIFAFAPGLQLILGQVAVKGEMLILCGNGIFFVVVGLATYADYQGKEH
ncbi:MAG: hypothetical protein OXG08_10890 [Gammaproteobacteria bacterium]|nr:hypothetical protein [Gammaproteobacteria bacterium]